MLDNELITFVRASIRSTWALETLILLRKHAPRSVASDELVRTLRATPTLVDTCLRQLQMAELVVAEGGGWRYAPAAPALDAFCAQLDQAYAERPVAIINAIVASPNDRLRNFSDAFRFPKKDD
jgi:hypothetical protein